MPFGEYDDFESCVSANADKSDPEAYCAAVKRRVEGKSATRDAADDISQQRLLQAALDHADDLEAVEKAAEETVDELVAEFLEDWEGTEGSVPNVSDLQEWVDATDRTELDAAVDLAGLVDEYRDAHPDADLGTVTVSDFVGWLEGADDMSPRQKSTAATGFDVVGGTLPDALTKEAQSSFDPQDPPEEFAAAIEADDFLIYGKASIEQRDLEGQRISVDALEHALDRFFESEDAPGIISRGHADVPVGVPVREHTLESDTTLVIDGERYAFDAGETIRTETKDADDDQLPELWLVSRLANDSDIARETRYKALTGDLNGYSVTVKPHAGATEQTPDGEDILSVDLHAVTVGTDEAIRNQGSEFDVAEYKALARVRDAPGQMAGHLRQRFSTMADSDTEKGVLGRLLQKAGEDLEDEAQTTEQKADDEDDDEMDEAEQEADPIDKALADGSIDPDDASELRQVADKMSSSLETLVENVADGSLEVSEAVEMIEDVYNGDPEKSDEEGDNAPEELKGEIDEEAVADLQAKLDDAAAAADRLDEIESKLDDLDERFATPDDVESAVETKLDDLAEESADEDPVGDAVEQKLVDIFGDDEDDEFSDVVQKANSTVAFSPQPTTGGSDDEQTLGDVARLGGD